MGSVSSATFIVLILEVLLGFLIPALLCLVLRKKLGGSVKPFLVGCITMFVSAMMLESLVHNLVYMSPLGHVIWDNIWLYAIYGGLMAGLFEEVGRFVAYKFFLKDETEDAGTPWMYGAGHGGFEVFFILVFNTVNQILYCIMINTGRAEQTLAGLPADQAEVVSQTFTSLVETPAYVYLVAVLERGSAVMLQLGLSVLVWLAVKKGGKLLYLFIAILVHMFVDSSMVLVNNYTQSVAITEGYILILGIAALPAAIRLWKKNKNTIVLEQEN